MFASSDSPHKMSIFCRVFWKILWGAGTRWFYGECVAQVSADSIEKQVRNHDGKQWIYFGIKINVHFQFNSNSIPNKSPALQLCLVMLVTQSFETTTCSPRFKYKTQTQELDF